MTLVRIVKNWERPDLMRQTPGRCGMWDDIQFTVDPVHESDFVVMLNNNMKRKTIVKCPKENVWALMQEPYVKGFTDWMVEGHEHFSRVYTHHPISEDSKYMSSHPAIPWHVNQSFDQLIEVSIPVKPKLISWIVGNARDIPGHFKRHTFFKYIQRENFFDIDVYGRAVRYIDDKWDGLAPYKYSFAIENCKSTDYWTEKLADCFLAWTVHLYYGCTNIERYFPADSFIRIDIENPGDSVNQIKEVLYKDDWEQRLPALTEARKLVLYEYQFFPHICKLIKSHSIKKREKEIINLPPYRRSNKTVFLRMVFKMRRMFMKLHYRFV